VKKVGIVLSHSLNIFTGIFWPRVLLAKKSFLHHIGSKNLKNLHQGHPSSGLWAKQNKYLEKALHRLQMYHKIPHRKTSRLHDKSSKTVAVICRAGVVQDSSCEYLGRNGFLHVKVWFLRASVFLI